MNMLAAAFGMTLGVSLALYLVLKLVFGLEGNAIEAVAGFPILASGQIYEALEKTAGRKNVKAGHQEQIPEFNTYMFKWYKLFAASLLLFSGLILLLGGYVGFVLGAVGVVFDIALVGLMQLPIIAAVSYALGRWVGTRSFGLKGGMLIVVTAIAVAMTFDRTYLMKNIMDDPNVANAGALGPFGSRDFFIKLASGVAVYSAFSCLGVWRGFRVRAQRYMAYLLSILPESDRGVLISLAYDQVQTRSLQAKPS